MTINNDGARMFRVFSGRSFANRHENNVNTLSRIHWRASLVPAAAVIPAPIAYTNIAVVKKLVVGSRTRACFCLNECKETLFFCLFLVLHLVVLRCFSFFWKKEQRQSLWVNQRVQSRLRVKSLNAISMGWHDKTLVFDVFQVSVYVCKVLE